MLGTHTEVAIMSIISRVRDFLAPSAPPVPTATETHTTDRIIRAGRGSLIRMAGSEMAPMGKAAPRDLLPPMWSNRPMWPTWDTESAVEHGLMSSGWVYTCAQKNANAIGSVPWEAQQWDGSSWVHQPRSPLQILINNPNPFWSLQHLMMLMSLELDVAGNTVLCKVRVDLPGFEGIPANLFTLRPNRIAPVPSQDIHNLGFIVGTADGRRHFVGASDVVHIQQPNPLNPYWGLSPLKAASQQVAIDRESAKWQRHTLSNLMVPPGMFVSKHPMTQEVFEDAKERLLEEYQASENARRPMLLGTDVEWKQLSMTPQELDFLESNRSNAESICAIMGVPAPIAGILQDANYANIRTAREIWWEDTLIPRLGIISGGLTRGVAHEFGRDWRLVPDTKAVAALMGITLKRIEAVKELWGMGVPFNQAASFMSLDLNIGTGDVGYLPLNLGPVTETGPLDPDMASLGRPTSQKSELEEFAARMMGDK
jgi:HK97 family phage portal protein